MNPADVPPGWEIWSAEADGRVVLAFRPDVFDADRFPAECLPTVFVSPMRDPRGGPARGTNQWRAELRLEPAVLVTERTAPDREGAAEAALEVAAAFSDGSIAYRDAYQEPRESYLDALDGLVPVAESDERDA